MTLPEHPLSLDDIKAALRRLRDEQTPTQREAAAALLLSARFLSEVEYLTEARGMTRRALAKALGTSPSYITQLYQGDRLLNLTMAAKLERVLGMKFQVKAVSPVAAAPAVAHPIQSHQLPRALSGRQFAHEQSETGGQLAASYVLPETTDALAYAALS